MKLLYCEVCGTIAVPHQHPFPIIYKIPVSCLCKESWAWWDNPEQGILKVYGPNASVLGIANGLLHANYDFWAIREEEMRTIIEEIPDNYLFKQFKSLIIKYKPGFTGDTIIVTKEELEKQIEDTKSK